MSKCILKTERCFELTGNGGFLLFIYVTTTQSAMTTCSGKSTRDNIASSAHISSGLVVGTGNLTWDTGSKVNGIHDRGVM